MAPPLQPNRPDLPDEAPSGALTRVDQGAVAVLVCAALAALALYWVAQGGLGGRLIEIDRAVPREIRFQVDINAADWPELSLLPGVGETLARRIVESRTADGPFQSIEDLRRVPGIGAKTLDDLRPHLSPLAAEGVVAGEEASR